MRYQTASIPSSTGTLWASGAVARCSSTTRKPASMSAKASAPIASMSDSPIAESTEYRPPTQSQKPNMFAGSMPKAADLAGVGGDGHEVRSDGVVTQVVDEPASRGVGVGDRLDGGERLRCDDEQRGGGIQVGQHPGHVGTIDVRHEPAPDPIVPELGEGLVGHHRTEVGPTDADVDDGRDDLAGGALPVALADAVGERRHLAEDAVHVGDHVVAVDRDDHPFGGPEGDVEHGAVLGGVDALAREHRLHPLGDAGPRRQREQLVDGGGVDAVLRPVDGEVADPVGHPLRSVGVRGEEVAQVAPLERDRPLGDRFPLVRVGDVHLPILAGQSESSASCGRRHPTSTLGSEAKCEGVGGS